MLLWFVKRSPWLTLFIWGCGAAFTLGGCGTTYEATAPRPVRASGVEASITRIEDAHVAEVHLADVSGGHLGGPRPAEARLGAVEREPCASGPLLWDPRKGAPPIVNERFAVALPPQLGALSRPGLTLDLRLAGESTCLRLPVTGDGEEILWRATSAGSGGSGHLGLEWPAVSAGGIGTALTAEMRFHRPIDFGGRWRLAFGLPFGLGGCRGTCPSLGWYGGRDGADIITGTFAHLGATASVARELALGGVLREWMLLPSLGYRTSAYFLGATSDWRGERTALLVGPFLRLAILRTRHASPPGFDPPPASRQGVELTLSALHAYHRAPEGVVWMIGLGWTFVDVG